VDLCINTLVTSQVPPIVILDKIPYDLYEIYKRKKLESANQAIRPIVKWIIARELYHQVFHIHVANEYKSILNCIHKNHRYPNGLYMNTNSYLERWYPKTFKIYRSHDYDDYDERMCYLDIHQQHTQ